MGEFASQYRIGGVNNMEKNICNHISKKGRCKEKATRVVAFIITDTFCVRTKFCKKHYEETKGLHDREEYHGGK